MNAWRPPPGLPRALVILTLVGVATAAHLIWLSPPEAVKQAIPRILPSRIGSVALEEVPPKDTGDAVADPAAPAPALETAEAPPSDQAEPGEGSAKRIGDELRELASSPRAAALADTMLGQGPARSPSLVFSMEDQDKIDVPLYFREEFVALPQRDDGLYFRVDLATDTYEPVRDASSGSGVVHEKDYLLFRSLPPRLARLKDRILEDSLCADGLYFFGTRLSDLEMRLVARRTADALAREGREGDFAGLDTVRLRYRREAGDYDIEVAELKFRQAGREAQR